LCAYVVLQDLTPDTQDLQHLIIGHLCAYVALQDLTPASQKFSLEHKTY
jgi:hypothetical protein